MSKFKLKPEYQGVIVTRTNMSLGQVTFDASKVDEKYFEKYVNLGFGELFEEEVITPLKSSIKDLPKFDEPVEAPVKPEKIDEVFEAPVLKNKLPNKVIKNPKYDK